MNRLDIIEKRIKRIEQILNIKNDEFDNNLILSIEKEHKERKRDKNGQFIKEK